MTQIQDVDLLDITHYTSKSDQELFRRLRDNDPVHYNEGPDGVGFYALTRYDHVSAIGRDHLHFINSKGTQIRDKRAEGHGAPSVHNADQPIHGRLRAPGVGAFRRSLLEQREGRIREIVRDLIDAVPQNQPFDFVEKIAVAIPMIVFAEVLGVPQSRQQDLVHWANTMSDVSACDTVQADARHHLFGYFRELAAEKRAHPGEDIASALVNADVGGAPLTQEELDAYFMVLTVAGNETTRFLLTGGLEAIINHPDQLAKLRSDPGLIPSAIEEMARWVSPVLQMRRTATEDGDLFGTPIKAGTKVVLYFSSANRDERAFDGADEFRVDRKNNRHLGFGVGAHFCMGAHLARLEAKIFLEEFLREIGEVEVVAPSTRSASNWFTGYDDLKLRWSR
jgi:cytochrome P450